MGREGEEREREEKQERRDREKPDRVKLEDSETAEGQTRETQRMISEGETPLRGGQSWGRDTEANRQRDRDIIETPRK